MVHELNRLGQRRYVGNSKTRTVHDRWHEDCQGCALSEAVRDELAVGFEPDTLDTALWAGYEYCETCIDKTSPSRPRWASGSSPPEEPEQEEVLTVAGFGATEPEHEAHRRAVFAHQGEKLD